MEYALFDRFEITMTREQAKSCAHPGSCDADVETLRADPEIARQLTALNAADVAAELHECGAWDANELSDHDANLARILWIAAGNICDTPG